ncbi:MAG: hypothetical protein HYX72_02830 [Acidobacteria bacterium]|nr:hypothetical protein [Acidobacteriota bacterium]
MLRKVLSIVILLAGSRLAAQDGPQLTIAGADFGFPKTPAGEVIEHEYFIINGGSKPFRLLKANMTPPLRAVAMPAVIPPNTPVAVRFRLDTSRVAGQFDGNILLITDDPDRPQINLTFQGEVVPLIEFDPLPAFFVSAQHGESKTASIEIINHQPIPLKIRKMESDSSRFVASLETIDPGKRYRLKLTTLANAPVGRVSETIRLATSDPAKPLLEIPANILVRERIYTFPDFLDFGALQPERLEGNLEQLSQTAQTLMVYQAGGKDFRISVQSDLPFLYLYPVRSKLGERYQIEIAVIPEKMKAGEFSGSIIITTNDKEFPKLVVPVKAIVEGS